MFNRTTATLAETALAAAVAFLAAAPSNGSSAIPITACGQNVTSNAVMTQDLVCAGLGIAVGAPGITIDLKGHTLRGTGNGYGIYNPAGQDHVTIKNGVVRNYTAGIRFWTSDDATVSNVVVSGNTAQGLYIDGNGVSIASSTASGNGNTGFIVTGTSARISSSIAAGNAIYGVSVNGDGASIKSSTISGNGWGGVFVTGNGAKLKANKANGNGFSPADGSGPGISVTAAVPPVGSNDALGNDDSSECHPASLC